MQEPQPKTASVGDRRFRVTRELTAEERHLLFDWDADPFQDLGLRLEWEPKEWHILLYEGDALVSHVGLLRRQVRVGERAILVGGVGAVITVPAAQGRGCARAAMQYAASFLKDEWQVPFAMLFCRPPLVNFYASLGWTQVKEPVWVEKLGAKILSPCELMVLPCQAEAWPAGVVDVCGLPW